MPSGRFPERTRLLRRILISVAAAAVLAACGGGGGGSSTAPLPAPPSPPAVGSGGGGSSGSGSSSQPLQWTEGVFAPASTFAAQCETPRTGFDADGRRFPDRSGSLLHEKHWLRAFSHELYLWFDEIIDRDPALFASPADYFDVLKTEETLPTGRPKDNFHFAIPTDEWQQQSQSGVTAGYGARWVILSATVPRDVVVAFTEPGTPAATNGLIRGTRVLEVDGIDVVNAPSQADVAVINEAIFGPAPGSSHTFTLGLPDGSETIVTMTAGNFPSQPVQNVRHFVRAPGNVGYLTFNDHNAPAEQQLIDAIAALRDEGISDLILDLRYNGGGFLTIASQLAFMIAGSEATAGRAFETLRFSSKHPTRNPVTGESLDPIPFRSTTAGFSASPAGQPLPELGLSRLLVLTGANTCSASETIINSLRGIDLEVIQIGARTCGKPYGTYPTDNCGTTWFTTMFQGINDAGFGDYPDGFSPAGTTGIVGLTLPGCSVSDDFSQPLGDSREARLAAGLAFLETGNCPSAPADAAAGRARLGAGEREGEGEMPGPEWLRNRILLP
ncbi:MAG: peptidase [Gammaproteobacteria bacterium]|nr:peptidase [Gammaproteobacteria bacterium]